MFFFLVDNDCHERQGSEREEDEEKQNSSLFTHKKKGILARQVTRECIDIWMSGMYRREREIERERETNKRLVTKVLFHCHTIGFSSVVC